MHHEFAHILHQKKNYPVEFNQLSLGLYDPLGWQYKTTSEAASLGFASPYGRSAIREDFVEIIANYLVKSDADWNKLLDMGTKPGIDSNGVIQADDGVNGKAIILQKLAMATKWLKDSWSIDIVKLRAEIMTREAHINEILN